MSQVLDDNNNYITANQATVYGLDGNDVILTSQPGPNLYGGEGSDFLGNSGTGSLDAEGGRGNDTIHGGTIADRIYGGEGNDLLVGGEFDYLSARNGTITPFAGEASGDDVLYGGGGSDALYGFEGNDILYGGDGNDTNINISSGTIKDDQFANTFYGSVTGGLYGGAGNDYLDGGSGNDYLDGGADADRLFGGDGNDILRGGTGADFMAGGAGSDSYEVDNAGDLVGEFAGGSDFDSVYSFVDYSMPTGVEALVLNGTARVGTGNSADNYIYGNASQNVIEGGAGYDVLTGGAGSDLFVVRPGWGVDYITDFTPGAGTPDAVLFDSSLFTSFAGVIGNSAQVGADTYIGDGLGNTVVLANVQRSALAPDDFAFI